MLQPPWAKSSPKRPRTFGQSHGGSAAGGARATTPPHQTRTKTERTETELATPLALRPTECQKVGPQPGTATRTTRRPKNRTAPKKPMSHMIAPPGPNPGSANQEPGRPTRPGTHGTWAEAGPRNGPNGRPRRNRATRNRTIRRTKARHLLDKAASSCPNIDAQATPRTDGKSTEHEPN